MREPRRSVVLRLVSIQTGPVSLVPPAEEGAPGGRSWRTAFFKDARRGPVAVGRLGLEGDAQADLRNHGGPDKAVCVYPSEHHAHWQAVLGVVPVPGGAFGENFTVAGGAETEVFVGDVLQVGSARVQVSQPRQPCWKLARRWGIRDLAARVERTGFTGWYFRVLQEGVVEAGAELEMLERPFPEWPLARANEVMHHRPDDREEARSLAACPVLSESWVRVLAARAATPDIR